MSDTGITFKLSGLGDSILENNVSKAVETTGYSDDELKDIREHANYSILDIKENQIDILERIANLHLLATLLPDPNMFNKGNKIKNIFKKMFFKIFRWYVEPIAQSQSNFNYEILSLLSELTTSINDKQMNN